MAKEVIIASPIPVDVLTTAQGRHLKKRLFTDAVHNAKQVLITCTYCDIHCLVLPQEFKQQCPFCLKPVDEND